MEKPSKVLSSLLGGKPFDFRALPRREEVATFQSDPVWFRNLASIGALVDVEELLDRAPRTFVFGTGQLLARSEARRHYEEGTSIYIRFLDELVKPLRDLCDGLADDLELDPSYVTIEAWAAGAPTNVGMHFDLDYNFNIQIRGRKRWQVARNESLTNPVRSHRATTMARHFATASGRELPTEMPADAQTIDVMPGDVVYVPRGTWHATRTTEPTMSMAFAVKPPTWAQHIARVLVDRLHDDERWRDRVLGGRDLRQHQHVKATGREALDAARHALDSLGPSEILHQSLWGGEPPYYRCRDSVVECAFDARTKTLSWRSGEAHEFAVPSWAESAADFVSGRPGGWSLAALHDLVGPNDVFFLNVLVTRLVDAGLLQQVRPPSGGVTVVPPADSST